MRRARSFAEEEANVFSGPASPGRALVGAIWGFVIEDSRAITYYDEVVPVMGTDRRIWGTSV